MSQRHKIVEQGSAANGEVHAQGVVAPGLAMQVDPENLNVLLPKEGAEGGVTIPAGPPGGPLAGSSLTGPIPDNFEPPEPPEPEPVQPTLTSLDPATAELNTGDVTMHCIGTGFTESSVIMFAGQPEPIVFISDTDITTIIKTDLPWGPATLDVSVKNGYLESEVLQFVFTEAVVELEGGERVFPLGPFDISLTTGDGELVSMTVPAGSDVQSGDTVTVEATGNTSVNGTYTVGSVIDGVVQVPSTVSLATPIENKGRLTVTAGA